MFIKKTIPLLAVTLFAALILGACNASQKTDIVSENEIKTEERGEQTGKQQVLPEQVVSVHEIRPLENEVTAKASTESPPVY